MEDMVGYHTWSLAGARIHWHKSAVSYQVGSKTPQNPRQETDFCCGMGRSRDRDGFSRYMDTFLSINNRRTGWRLIRLIIFTYMHACLSLLQKPFREVIYTNEHYGFGCKRTWVIVYLWKYHGENTLRIWQERRFRTMSWRHERVEKEGYHGAWCVDCSKAVMHHAKSPTLTVCPCWENEGWKGVTKTGKNTGFYSKRFCGSKLGFSSRSVIGIWVLQIIALWKTLYSSDCSTYSFYTKQSDSNCSNWKIYSIF